MHAPEGKEPMSLVVKPQKNDAPKTASRDILGVRLTYQDGSAISKTLSYQDRLRATAKCQNLEGEYIIFELYEDDESGSGHNRKNQSIIKSPPISVDSRAHIIDNAEPKSLGKCAFYVRKAINAGGINNIYGHAKDYYDTDKLVKYGFTNIGTDLDSIQLKKGDIVAFAAVKGHPYGHIAMWTGTQWISDFKQKDFWVANQYSVEKKYAIYRWIE